MKIHIVSTVNGQQNEGMRNIATHMAKEFSKENTVFNSGLKNAFSIIRNSLRCDVTFVFVRLNEKTYPVIRLISALSRKTCLVTVQRPDASFIAKIKKHPLRCDYFTLCKEDSEEIVLAKECKLHVL